MRTPGTGGRRRGSSQGSGWRRETARTEPARGLLDTELRVIELARVHVVEPGAGA